MAPLGTSPIGTAATISSAQPLGSASAAIDNTQPSSSTRRRDSDRVNHFASSRRLANCARPAMPISPHAMPSALRSSARKSLPECAEARLASLAHTSLTHATNKSDWRTGVPHRGVRFSALHPSDHDIYPYRLELVSLCGAIAASVRLFKDGIPNLLAAQKRPFC